MKFGIFYELQLPRPWKEGDEHRLYQNALSQLELADKLGYDYAWEVEHHFLEEYSHSPSPASFLAAASQRTKQIRLGHGILQLTTNHPAHIAERVASLEQDLTQRTAGVALLRVAPEQGGQTFAALLVRLAEGQVGEQSARPAIGQVHVLAGDAEPDTTEDRDPENRIAPLHPGATGWPRPDDWG
jgi:hypothetical protein